ncbi:MAG: DNA-protecting protein DprA [Bacteroidales bacterium]|nr:DNA-protecting protein DprA [Bacteroidales bacterium]
MTDDLLRYKIGISQIPGIGSIIAKKLIAYTGSIEAVFKEKKKNLIKIPGIGTTLAEVITKHQNLEKAEAEIEFIRKFDIRYHFYLDDDYPVRLKQCPDAPIMLFCKGNVEFNKEKVISIVGTRNATDYGKEFCTKLVSDLASRHKELIIVSGLAYGIDICAHRASLKNHVPTVAVLAHGLSTLYPAVHRNTAKEIVNNGALVTDFTSEITPERNNFIKRNRIIAGLADATIVAESGIEGGALITADLANSYNRDVFAFPGRVNDDWSKGCNKLIKNNKAAMIESVEDLEYLMGWDSTRSEPRQMSLFQNLTEEEQLVIDLLREENNLMIDIMCLRIDWPVSRLSPLLLQLEFKGLIKSLPGKIYRLIN